MFRSKHSTNKSNMFSMDAMEPTIGWPKWQHRTKIKPIIKSRIRRKRKYSDLSYQIIFNIWKRLLDGTLFRPLTSYWPELIRPITSYWPEPLSNVRRYWLGVILSVCLLVCLRHEISWVVCPKFSRLLIGPIQMSQRV